MQNSFLVDEIYSLADLPHENRATLLRQHKIIIDDSLEQFPSFDPAKSGLAPSQNAKSTHNSKITHITFPFSKASYNWMSLGCWSVFMMSTSRSTFLRSSFFGTAINFAASCKPVAFSRHLYTVPNLPLQRTSQNTQICGLCFYRPTSVSKSYNSLGSTPLWMCTSL
jgi:hypothetical protein